MYGTFFTISIANVRQRVIFQISTANALVTLAEMEQLALNVPTGTGVRVYGDTQAITANVVCKYVMTRTLS